MSKMKTFSEYLGEKVYSTKGMYDVPDMKDLKKETVKNLKFKQEFYAEDRGSKSKELALFRVSERFVEAGWIDSYMAKNPSLGYRFSMDETVYVVK